MQPEEGVEGDGAWGGRDVEDTEVDGAHIRPYPKFNPLTLPPPPAAAGPACDRSR